MFWEGAPYASQLVQPADGSYDPGLGTQTVENCTDYDVDQQHFDGTPWESGQHCQFQDRLSGELTESVSFPPAFPVQFELPVLGLPPTAARVDLAKVGGVGTFAFGHVIAFVDADGDGKLDLGRVDVEPEQVLARSTGNPVPDSEAKSSYWVVYLDGEIDVAAALPAYQETLAALPQGFSIWHTVETPADEPSDKPERKREVLPIDAFINLFGDASLADSTQFCETWELDVRYVAEAFTPDHGFAFCSADGTDYEARRLSDTQGACRESARYFRRNVSALAESDIPTDWPCTLE
jgi:hypothetical protein